MSVFRCLTNICGCGSQGQSRVILAAAPLLLLLLPSSSDGSLGACATLLSNQHTMTYKLQEQACWAIGNLAAEDDYVLDADPSSSPITISHRSVLIANGALSTVMHYCYALLTCAEANHSSVQPGFQLSVTLATIQTACWTLCNLIRGDASKGVLFMETHLSLTSHQSNGTSFISSFMKLMTKCSCLVLNYGTTTPSMQEECNVVVKTISEVNWLLAFLCAKDETTLTDLMSIPSTVSSTPNTSAVSQVN